MMVEHGISGAGGNDKFPVQSPSAVTKYQETTSSTYHTYPPPLATYEDVAASRELFMDTLKKLHASMGTKFMIPIVGGRDLDLHRLFVEVTSRGGIAKVVKDRKWKEVTAVFSFPSSATNASFILRKYYVSLLYHYEQMYFFKAKCWTPSPGDAIQHLSTITAPSHGLPEYTPLMPERTNAPRENSATSMPQVSLSPSSGSPVHGVIDGKFDSGYLVTVKIGVEEFKGVLYQIPSTNNQQIFTNHITQSESAAAKFMNSHLSVKSGATRRKRRKKSEIRKRDPAHPKPNRSGYNFFFAEQHARLKPHYHGKDREISRIIGELWNKLQEPERAVYQEKALKDKERYKIEMEDYRERLRTGQLVRTVVPTKQHAPLPQVISTTDLNTNIQLEPENEACSEKSDKSILEEYDSADDNKDSDFEEYSQAAAAADTELKNVNIEIMADEAFDLQTRRVDGTRDENNKIFSFQNDDIVLGEDGISVPIEEREQHATTGDAGESVPGL